MATPSWLGITGVCTVITINLCPHSATDCWHLGWTSGCPEVDSQDNCMAHLVGLNLSSNSRSLRTDCNHLQTDWRRFANNHSLVYKCRHCPKHSVSVCTAELVVNWLYEFLAEVTAKSRLMRISMHTDAIHLQFPQSYRNRCMIRNSSHITANLTG